MLRKAFRMSVNAGQEAEYERRHRPIWPDLETTLIQHGVTSYSIFLDPETRDLFAYVELQDETQWAGVAETGAAQRWWRYMRDLMPTNADGSPVARDLREVFHIEERVKR
jgi:L-rhamnose mutarotase